MLRRCFLTKIVAGAELARQGKKLPLLGDDDVTADRNYIKEFVMGRSRELGRKYGVEYAEVFSVPSVSPW
jgi:hypothetical protein